MNGRGDNSPRPDAETPDITSPFPYRVNPHAEQAREHLAAWAREAGLVHRESARLRFERADFGWFAALVYPSASARHLELMADWFAWLFLVDDQLDDGLFGRSQDQVGEVVGQMRAVLEGHGPRTAGGGHVPTAVSSLADLWERTVADAPQGWPRRFIDHLERCLSTAAQWEAGNRIGGLVPPEDTYIANRRHTGAIYVCMDLIEIVQPAEFPESVRGSREFTAALDAACNVVCWTNDVYSLAKERALGEVHNLVHVVEHHRGLSEAEALAHVRTAIDRETGLFLACERETLAAHPRWAEPLGSYLQGMRTWMRGNLDWSRHTKRYRTSAATGEERPEEYLEDRLTGADR
ncbi:terpene synthase family protein [Streptomyces sp. CBMA29]|uniref:terpene synthase family protein n=1 Tax=Streptomyces sp. CBMA29 TaxID=1896314 RepID=UPI001661C6CB|nr:terpene cyclase [Streptomyces sp. CBMA29]MBD0737951.1 terpene cyclase [Streptomyces sp. CBMA29]